MNGEGHRKNSVESTTSTNSSVDATNKKKDTNGDAKDKLEVKPGNSNNIILKIYNWKYFNWKLSEIKRDKTMPDKFMYIPMMIHKITPSVYYD